ncbi:hypothetical protein EDC04DRAFT_2603279 [Pisolithus marmoratus]|nr:hypothetical protein EDC04DRAFT_2603279 [Pisolithus marmoratus]
MFGVISSITMAYAKVLCAGPHFWEQFSMTFDVYVSIQHSIQAHMDQELGHGDPNWHLQHSCPASTFKQSGEPILVPSSLKAMDGNNSVKQMAHLALTYSKMVCAYGWNNMATLNTRKLVIVLTHGKLLVQLKKILSRNVVQWRAAHVQIIPWLQSTNLLASMVVIEQLEATLGAIYLPL